MFRRLPTNCQRKLFNLLARLDTDATIDKATNLNRAELCQSSLYVFMNDSQTVDELPTKIHLWARQYTGATINE